MSRKAIAKSAALPLSSGSDWLSLSSWVLAWVLGCLGMTFSKVHRGLQGHLVWKREKGAADSAARRLPANNAYTVSHTVLAVHKLTGIQILCQIRQLLLHIR